MIPVALGFVAVACGLWLTFRLLEGSKYMVTFDPARAWQEGRLRRLVDEWNQLKLPVEPINTWSNLAYYVAGWVPFMLTRTDHALVFAAFMTWLCIGSALFHATLTDWGQVVADHGGMIAVFTVLVAFGLAPEEKWSLVPMVIGGMLGAFLGGRKFRGSLNTIMGTGFAITFMIGVQTRPILAGLALGLFVIWAVISLGLDKADSPFLGRWKHGISHAVSAVAFALMFTSMMETVG